MTIGLPDLLHTERLTLRRPMAADAAPIFAGYAQDPDVTRYLTWRPHTSLEQAQAFIAGCEHDWRGGLRRAYVLTLKEADSAPVGMLEARCNAPRSAHTVELGYVLVRAWWGQGLMPEAVSALTAEILALPPVFRVQAGCDVDNRGSARVLEKAGFTREGRLERCTIHPNLGPDPRACFLYARCR